MQNKYVGARSKSKYYSEKVTVGGLKFDSKLELEVYTFLIEHPNIKDVELHAKCDLIVEGKLACKVIPDFKIVLISGAIFFADAKSNATETDVSKLKFKLFKILYKKKIWILPREKALFTDSISKA